MTHEQIILTGINALVVGTALFFIKTAWDKVSKVCEKTTRIMERLEYLNVQSTTHDRHIQVIGDRIYYLSNKLNVMRLTLEKVQGKKIDEHTWDLRDPTNPMNGGRL